MPNAEDLTIDANNIKGMSLLLKGPFGFSKTLAACSAAIDGPLWLAYWDKPRPIELLWFDKIGHSEIRKNITYDVYSSHNANEFLNKLISETKRPEYATIVVDSVTMMTASAVNWSLGFRDVKGGAKKDPLNDQSIRMIPDWDEYKVETSLVTQALDLCRALAEKNGTNIIWTCHPIPGIKLDASGGKVATVTKVNNIVSYGSKVAGIVPGQFSEIYHFSKETEWDSRKGETIENRKVNTRSVGDEYAKTALNLPGSFDITDKLFWSVWKELVIENNKPNVQD